MCVLHVVCVRGGGGVVAGVDIYIYRIFFLLSVIVVRADIYFSPISCLYSAVSLTLVRE